MNDPRQGFAKVGSLKDLITGLMFMAIGGVYAAGALSRLSIGTASNMGPGYFPLLLSGALVVVGIIVAGRSFVPGHSLSTPIPWRAIALVTFAPLLLAITFRGLGFIPAVFLAAVAAAFADRKAGLLYAVIVAAGVTAAAAAIFLYALGFNARPFGPWLGFS